GQHLRFEDDRDGEVAGDLRGLGGGACDAAPEERRAVAGEEGLRFVLVEPHGPDAEEREAANTLRRQGSSDGPRGRPSGRRTRSSGGTRCAEPPEETAGLRRVFATRSAVTREGGFLETRT